MAAVNYGIIDTGYASTAESGTQFSGTNIVNSGNEITLPVDSLTFDAGAGISSNPEPGKFDDATVNFVSTENPKVTLNGVLNMSSATATANVTKIGYMNGLVKTPGVKIFYYGSISDGYKDLTEALGTTGARHASNGGYTDSSTPYIDVRVLSIRFVHDSRAQSIRYTMVLEVTG